MTNTTYNGWSNRATWLANLWLSNDRKLYDHALRTVATGVDRGWAMAILGDFLVDDLMSRMQLNLRSGDHAMYNDFVLSTGERLIPEINRVELAEHWLADLEDARAHGEIIKPRMIGAQ